MKRHLAMIFLLIGAAVLGPDRTVQAQSSSPEADQNQQGGSATTAASDSGEDDLALGLGLGLTQIDSGALSRHTFLPLLVITGHTFASEFGFGLRSGEDVTNIMFQFGGSFYPINLRRGEVGFGLQFNLETDAVGSGADGSSLTAMGFFVEYQVSLQKGVQAGVRIFPFLMTHMEDYTRTSNFAPGLSLKFFF